MQNLYPDVKLNLFISNTPFVRFVEQQKAGKSDKTDALFLADFIKEYQVCFALATPQADISELGAVQQVITDSKTGERFVVLVR